MSPNSVNAQNVEKLRNKLYPPSSHKIMLNDWHKRLELGDQVRVSHKPNIFDKRSDRNWSDEVFEVWERRNANPITYQLQNMLGEKLNGEYYRELQKIDPNNTPVLKYKSL
jgi:hypothetical protein